MKPIQKVAKWMIIVSLLISVAALTVGVLALIMKQYVIAAAMALLTIWQAWNCKQWRKRR